MRQLAAVCIDWVNDPYYQNDFDCGFTDESLSDHLQKILLYIFSFIIII